MKKRNKILFGAGAVAGIAGSIFAAWHYIKAKALQENINTIPY